MMTLDFANCALVDALMYSARVMEEWCDEAERAEFYSAFEWESGLTLPEYRALFARFVELYLDELCAELAEVEPEGMAPAQKLSALTDWTWQSGLANSELSEVIAQFAIDHR